MELFDNNINRVNRFSKYSESHYRFLNICAKPEFKKIRDKIKEWFSHYPKEEQAEFIERFCTDNNEQFMAAFFELLIHEVLLKLNYQIQIHPYLLSRQTRPDFLVTNDTGEEFYLEVAISTNLSKQDIGRKKILNEVFDIINDIDTYNFFIKVVIRNYPNKPIPVSRLKKFLQNEINTLNPDYCENIIHKFGWDSLPKWEFSFNGFEIEFSPIPKDQKHRHKKTSAPIGITHYPLQWIDSKKPLVKSLKYKAKKYGDLGKPYVIAINALDHSIDTEDIFETLFGSVVYKVGVDNLSINNQERLPDGFWYSKTGITYTRVSALMVGLNIYPWSIGTNGLKLYHNPWAKISYSGDLCKLPQYKSVENNYEEIPGTLVKDILGIQEKWPHV